jgi:hypothetical protein
MFIFLLIVNLDKDIRPDLPMLNKIGQSKGKPQSGKGVCREGELANASR